MKTLSIKRILLLKVFGFLILFQTTLFSENVYHVSSRDTTIVNSKVINSGKNKEKEDIEMISLDSFGGVGVVLMILFISFLGVFFVREEISNLID